MSIFTIIGLLLIFMKVLEVIDISWLLAISPFAIFPIANFLRILYSDPRKRNIKKLKKSSKENTK